jgi:nucleoside-diphosphate-sugar epimerase
VVHTASPLSGVSNADCYRTVIEPAVNGTKNVLGACARAGGSVKRVCLTSSIAAITPVGSHGKTLNEECWNTNGSMIPLPFHVFCRSDLCAIATADPLKDSYDYAKTEAEKAAWAFIKELNAASAFSLITFCPGFILGPQLTTDLNNTGLMVS